MTLSHFDLNEFAKYTNNAIYVFLEKVLRLGLTFVVGIMVARYLGPYHYGQLSYALSFVFLFAILGHLGIDSILVNQLVRKQESIQSNILGTAFVMRLAGALLALLIILILVNTLALSLSLKAMIILIAFSMIFQSFQVIQLFFESQVQSKYVTSIQMILVVILSIIRILFIINEVSVIWFAGVFLFEWFLLSLGLVWQYKKFTKKSFLSCSFDWSYFKKLFKLALPMMLSLGFILVYMRVDQIMIQHFLGSTSVGYYAVAVHVSDALIIFPHILAASLFPAMVQIKEKNLFLYHERLRQFFSLMFIISGLFTVCIWLVPVSWFSFFIGDSYIPAIYLLRVYSLGFIFVFWSKVTNKVMVNDHLLWHDVARKMSGLVLNVVLNWFFIQQWGVLGAAFAFLISVAFMSHFYFLIFNKTHYIYINQIKSIYFMPTLSMLANSIMNYFKRS